MGRLYRRGRSKTYWGDYRDQAGERQRHSLRTEDREVAKARLRTAELGQAGGASHAPKFLAHAIDDMIATKRTETAAHYKKKSLHLMRVLGGEQDINTLTRAQVVDYANLRLKEKADRHTIHKELVVLRQSLKEARKREEFGGSVDIVPNWNAEYQPRTRWLTPAEFTALLAAAKPQRRPWLMLQVYSSANYGEVSKMTWDHIDFERGQIRVPGTKRNSRFRQVPLHPTLRAFLEPLDRAAALVPPWTKANWWLRETCRKLGFPHASTNDLRRTFGSWLKQAGVDSLAVAHLMGHSSVTMVNKVYGQLSQATYDDAISKMPAHDAGGTPAARRKSSQRKPRKPKRE